MNKNTLNTKKKLREEIHGLWRKLVYNGGLTPRQFKKFKHLKKLYNEL